MDRRLGPLKPGDRFLKYEIRRLIGRGGHAYVYEAHDAFLNLDVAVKVIPSSADTGKDLGARARAEARVLVRIAHDHVVKVMDAGASEEGQVYLIMELLRGRDLRKTLHQVKRLTVIEALHAARQLADGVAAAHRLGAVHRDLKPENVFIEPGEKFKVLDFGVAKVMGYGAPTTQRDLLHGTALYMSPEQLRGLGATDKSDTFALGTMLYEALHAHPVLLWGGGVPGLEELGKRIIQAVPPLLNELDPTIPSYVARLVQRAIAKKPEQRFADMDEFSRAASDALRRYLSEARAAGHEPRLRELSSASTTPVVDAPRGDTDVIPAPFLASTSPSPVQGGQPIQTQPTVRLQPDSVLIAETRTRTPIPAPALQETPPPTYSSAAVARSSSRRSRPILWAGGAVTLGLGLGIAYEFFVPTVAPPAPAIATMSARPPVAAVASVAPSLPAPATATAASTTPPASSATPHAVAHPHPTAARSGPSAKPGAFLSTLSAPSAQPSNANSDGPVWVERAPKKPAAASTAVPDVSELPSSGLDD